MHYMSHMTLRIGSNQRAPLVSSNNSLYLESKTVHCIHNHESSIAESSIEYPLSKYIPAVTVAKPHIHIIIHIKQ